MKFRGDGKTPEFPNGREYRVLRHRHLNASSEGSFDSISSLVRNLRKIEPKHPYVEVRHLESSKRAPLDKEMLPVSTRTGAGLKLHGAPLKEGYENTRIRDQILARPHSGKLLLFRRYSVCAFVGKDARTVFLSK